MLPHVKEPWKLGGGLGTDPFCHLAREHGPHTLTQTFGLQSGETVHVCSSGQRSPRSHAVAPMGALELGGP